MSDDDGTLGPAPPETVRVWVEAMKSMGPEVLADFERRTFATWDRASLGDVRRAIGRRWRELVAMILMTDPPVSAFSPPDDVRAREREVSAMRER